MVWEAEEWAVVWEAEVWAVEVLEKVEWVVAWASRLSVEPAKAASEVV